MEKFRQFADESTGINPYIPIWGQTKTSILRKIIGFPILITRSIILSICLIMFTIFSMVIELMYLEHLRIIFFSIFLNGLSRVILLCFGCIWISENLDKNTKSSSSNDEKKSKATRKVIYVNRQGFCDIFVCSTILGDPEYMFMDNSGIYLASNSFYALLFSIGLKKNIRGGISFISSSNKLKSIYNNSLRPLIVFMEEVNTNGTCILEWTKMEKIPDTLEMRDLFSENSESIVIQYKLERSLYGPQFTTGDFINHLINMLSKITHFKIDLRIISNQVMKNRISRKNDDKNSNISLKDLQKKRRIDDLLTNIQNIQGKSCNLPIVTSGAEEAQGFIEYWEKTNKGKSI
ncbi:Uncharacterized protein CTYZ_00000700 [Cryptosporidium tyzzeri]|nr:Uncharacterized protein CTYZ_00000700 [Cryptosporidium tyzzeri]